MNSKAYLHPKAGTINPDTQSPRQGFGEGLVEAGDSNDSVVAICADVTESSHMKDFIEKYPDRYVEMGVAEQNMATVASGLAAVGKIPFMASYAMFSPGRNWEQIRTTIAYNNQPVKIVGLHAGVSVEYDGATHQALEDLAIMTVMPNMDVIVPCDSDEAKRATLAIAKTKKPSYLRLPRANTAVITTDKTPFEIGKAYVLKDGSDLTIIVCGPLVQEALLAAVKLKNVNISVEVINCPTIKPIDAETIISSVKKTKLVITLEEAQTHGGLGGVIAELVSSRYPVPVMRLGIQDRFGQSGSMKELWQEYGVDADTLTKLAIEFVKKVKS